MKENHKSKNKDKGNKSEQIAENYLLSIGYEVIDKNWHYSNRGELDIIAIDPSRYGEKYLVFTEVRSRSESMDLSLRSLSKNKQTQLKKLAKAYLYEHHYNVEQTNISFDFIAVHEQDIKHIKDCIS